jgi:ATP-dependent DNA helicase PIF1
MTQNEALNILKTGGNVFLTGEPGAGKTYTINAYVSYLRSCDIEPAITASTGIAATHIGGMTIHSWSGIGIKTKFDKYDLDKIGSSEYIVRRVRKTKVLIIDEVSMLSKNMLDMVDMVCREIKQNSEPFGGMQIVLVGDFFQLPPIIKRNIDDDKQETLIENKATNFAYDSSAWERAQMITCYISEQYRQDDSEFLSVLSAIRADDVSEEHFNHIASRQVAEVDAPANITKLFSHNIDVDRVNDVELAKLKTEEKSFLMTSEGNLSLVTALKKGCLSPEVLKLKVGAVVMCTKNNPKERFVNGTLGTIIDFDNYAGYPIVKTRNGKNITIEPMDWTVEENGKIRAQISQVPLRLAWAITVHKSQGMSLDAAVMDLSQVFEFGQGYVALSRVRRISGLYLLGINSHALKVHPAILERDIDFKNKSKEATQFFGKLPASEIKKLYDNFVLACGGKVKKQEAGNAPSIVHPLKYSNLQVKPESKSFEEVRKKYPNAYRPWEKEQDAELVQLFKAGLSTADLVKRFGRQGGSIYSRLEKLGLKK